MVKLWFVVIDVSVVVILFGYVVVFSCIVLVSVLVVFGINGVDRVV